MGSTVGGVVGVDDRRRWVRGCVTALVVGGLIWVGLQRQSVGEGVVVVSDAVPVDCVGTEFGPEERDPDEDGQILGWVIDVVPEMRCEIRFHVVNNRSEDVAIESIAFPGLGSVGGGGVRAVFLNPTRGPAATYSRASPWRDGADAPDASRIEEFAFGEEAGFPVGDTIAAIWDVDDVVPAFGSLDYSMWFDWRPDGCTSSGTFGVSGPTVVVAGWGRDVPISAPPVPFLFRGTGANNC